MRKQDQIRIAVAKKVTGWEIWFGLFSEPEDITST